MSFFLIAGPCVIEDEEMPFLVADKLKKITEKLDIPFIFKASYKKANRTGLKSFTGIDENKALNILSEIRKRYNVPVITDIHESCEAERIAQYVDYLQIPAFLCRQTALLKAAGRTGKGVNIKKGQFLSPEAMRFAAEKVAITGNNNIWLTERGTTFGYNSLVVDFTSVPKMKKIGYPVVVDCTHSIQRPNLIKGITGGDSEMIETICLLAIASGADGLFIETHPDTDNAKCDATSMLKLHKIEAILTKCKAIAETINSFE